MMPVPAANEPPYPGIVLVAEELALVAVDPGSGRFAFGTGTQLNACLAGLLVAELLLDGSAAQGKSVDQVVLVPSRPPSHRVLVAAARVVGEKGPKLKGVFQGMAGGLRRDVGMSTWDAVADGLVAAGVLGPPRGSRRPSYPLLDSAARDAVVARLSASATGNGRIEPRTALVLSMTGPAQLLETVCPNRKARKEVRNRIDHALDDSELKPVGKVVRRLIEEASSAAVTAAIMGGVVASS